MRISKAAHPARPPLPAPFLHLLLISLPTSFSLFLKKKKSRYRGRALLMIFGSELSHSHSIAFALAPLSLRWRSVYLAEIVCRISHSYGISRRPFTSSWVWSCWGHSHQGPSCHDCACVLLGLPVLEFNLRHWDMKWVGLKQSELFVN